MSRVVLASLALIICLLSAPASSNVRAELASPVTGHIRWAYYIPDDPSSLASLRQRAGDLDYVALHWGEVRDDGSLRIQANAEVIRLVRTLRASPILCVTPLGTGAGGGPETAHRILATPESRARAVESLAISVADYDGISIDFEGLYPEDRGALTDFMSRLAARLRPAGKLVSMAISAKTSDTLTGWAAAMDYAALAPSADLFILMAYGYRTGRSTQPGSTAPISWVQSTAAFAATQIPPGKILLGVPLYGYDWDTTAGPPAKAMRYPDTMAIAGKQGVSVEIDPAQQSAHFGYTSDGRSHQVWFEDRTSVEAKLALVDRYRLAGVAFWRLGHEDPTLWQSPIMKALAVARPQFKLGFRTLADQIVDVVGLPLEDERWGRNGDSMQRTSSGLMVWRKADNWTAFTDGHITWISGPFGLQSRPNTQRFAWEGER